MPYATCRTLLFATLLGCTASLPAAATEFLFAATSLDAPAGSAVAAPQVNDAAFPAPAPLAPTSRQLRELELELGAFAPQLGEQYLQHAHALQQAGRHEAALDALAKAAHSLRVQDGLFAPQLFAIVASEVESHLARHDYLKAFEHQDYLLFLQRRHHGADALETAPTQAALGDLYFDAFRKLVLQQESPARLLPQEGPQSLYLAPEDLTRHQLAYLWLGHSQQQYSAAIDTLLQHKAYGDPLLVELEQQLMQSFLLQAFERRIAIDPRNYLRVNDSQLRDTLRMDEREHQQPFYRAGIEAHERVIAYRQAVAAADPELVAQAMLALGDWHLLFGRTAKAKAQYAQASRYLAAAGCAPGVADRILQPSLPRQLPAFAAFEDARDDVEFSGYVDVAFSIGRNGRVQDVEVLGGRNADAAVSEKLRRELRRAPFRPALAEDGRPLREQRVSLRYHFAQI